MNLNKVFLVGRVVRDPELRSLPSGKSVVKFTVATNKIYTEKSGEKKETAQFHNCVVFGKLAEVVSQYVVRGQEVFVEGRIECRQWEKDGVKKFSTEIVGETVQFGQRAKNIGAESGAVKADDLPF